jgi:hypothetical protein
VCVFITISIRAARPTHLIILILSYVVSTARITYLRDGRSLLYVSEILYGRSAARVADKNSNPAQVRCDDTCARRRCHRSLHLVSHKTAKRGGWRRQVPPERPSYWMSLAVRVSQPQVEERRQEKWQYLRENSDYDVTKRPQIFACSYNYVRNSRLLLFCSSAAPRSVHKCFTLVFLRAARLGVTGEDHLTLRTIIHSNIICELNVHSFKCRREVGWVGVTFPPPTAP